LGRESILHGARTGNARATWIGRNDAGICRNPTFAQSKKVGNALRA
jgi:hypothetical protein